MSALLPSADFDAYAHHGRHIIQAFHAKLQGDQPVLTGPPVARGAAMRADSGDERPIGILGAGPGGLYAALILQDLGIPYRLVEARDEVGGRLFTYHFNNTTGAPYNYYDVGAMRFPKIKAMERVFKLFIYPPLNTGDIQLNDKLKEYRFADKNAFFYYNGVLKRQYEVSEQNPDPFKAKEVILDNDDSGRYIAAGTTKISRDVIEPFAQGILDDLTHGGSKGWDHMKLYDHYSTRAYMSLKYTPSAKLAEEYKLPEKPLSTDVVNWCETFDKSTGWYDRALSETVLEAIAFGWKPDSDPNHPTKETEWYCIDGGAQQIAKCMYDYIKSCNPNAVSFNSRVTAIALNENNSSVDITTDSRNEPNHKFSHVISTIPLPVLRTIDLAKADLSPIQSNALRELDYGPSIKIGMLFKTAWWTTGTDRDGNPLNIIGGQSYTDRPLRTVVYPSFGDAAHGKTTTLIASYCWTEDAMRMGALIDVNDNKFLDNLVLRELSDVHNVSVDFLREQLIESHAWSWSHDPYTMGAFAFFGPGKFESLYTSLNNPAAKGHLHFAGEAISVRHAWVEGALDSAWKAVYEILIHSYPDLIPKFLENWGMNPEWVVPAKPTGTRGRGPMTTPAPKPENNLLFQHLMLTNPDVF